MIGMNDIEALFRRLSTGVYVVGAAHGSVRNAFTAAWIMQVSYEPLLLALSINPHHATYPLVHASRAFSVSVLKSGALDLARRFGTRSGRDGDKLAGVAWRPGMSGAPVLDDALAYFDCEVARSLPAGDHELIVARVIDGHILDVAATAGWLPGAVKPDRVWFFGNSEKTRPGLVSLTVPLTTIRMPTARMGAIAAEMLIKHVEAHTVLPPQHAKLESELIVRASVKRFTS